MVLHPGKAADAAAAAASISEAVPLAKVPDEFPGSGVAVFKCGAGGCPFAVDVVSEHLELHLWIGSSAGLGLEISIVAGEPAHACNDVVGKKFDCRIISLKSLVVLAAFDSDAILGAGQFVLEAEEILVRAEFGGSFQRLPADGKGRRTTGR
jgi:hypothetical protein